MHWIPIWLTFAVLMAIFIVAADAQAVTYGLCFFAWLGGGVSLRTLQAINNRRHPTP